MMEMITEIQKATATMRVEASTDGGYDPGTNLGTIGISINGTRFGLVIQDKCSSSTQPEIVAQMYLRIALKLAGGVPRGVEWKGSTDSTSSLARYHERHRGDPVHTALHCSDCPVPVWERGHADNEAINNADAAATEARQRSQACALCQSNKRCNRCQLISVKTLYALAGIRSYCVHTPSKTVQMDTLSSFIKNTVSGKANDAVRRATKGWAPPDAMDPKILGKIMRFQGARQLSMTGPPDGDNQLISF